MAKKILFVLLINGFILLLLGTIAEVFVRVTTPEQEYSDKTIMHKQLGWKPKANYSSEYEVTNFGPNATRYPVSYQTFKHGFRAWGDLATEKPKVMIVGDSYVQSVEVSNNKTFYHYLGDSLEVEVFAIGQAGYGTFQEKILLDSFFNVVDPDLVVITTCNNDFIDNYAELELTSDYKVGLRRPYLLANGEVEYRIPVPRWQAWTDKSKFLKLLRMKAENAFDQNDSLTAQDRIAKEKDDFLPYKEAKDVTKMVFEQIKNLIGEVPIYVVSTDAYNPQLTDMGSIVESIGIPFDSISTITVRNRHWKYNDVHSADGYHYNELGHQIFAESLIARLKPIVDSLKTK